MVTANHRLDRWDDAALFGRVGALQEVPRRFVPSGTAATIMFAQGNAVGRQTGSGPA
jgi:hypothetical protein